MKAIVSAFNLQSSVLTTIFFQYFRSFAFAKFIYMIFLKVKPVDLIVVYRILFARLYDKSGAHNREVNK